MSSIFKEMKELNKGPLDLHRLIQSDLKLKQCTLYNLSS